MSQQSQSKTIIFVASMSIVCALVLSALSGALRKGVCDNKRDDAKKSILDSFLVIKYSDEKAIKGKELPFILENSVKKDGVNKHFEEFINTRLITEKGEDITENTDRLGKIKPDEIFLHKSVKDEKDLKDAKRSDIRLPLIIHFKNVDGKKVVDAIGIQIWGKGLWGPINGYLTLEYKDKEGKIDLRTIRGITFLGDHKETPGLGKEMEREDWRIQFHGKKTHDKDGVLRSVTVIKGLVAGSKYDAEKEHYMDGLAGSTLTCNGITEMLSRCVGYYQKYFDHVRSGKIKIDTLLPKGKSEKPEGK